MAIKINGVVIFCYEPGTDAEYGEIEPVGFIGMSVSFVAQSTIILIISKLPIYSFSSWGIYIFDSILAPLLPK